MLGRQMGPIRCDLFSGAHIPKLVPVAQKEREGDMRPEPRDPYREWSYQDRCDARHDHDQRENVQRYDADSESSDRAYDSYRSGKDFRDPNPDGRFH